jgi:hypothetical protein
VAETTKLYLLKQAVRRFGIEVVAAELRVPLDSVDLWSRGMAAMPDYKVLALINLLGRINKA